MHESHHRLRPRRALFRVLLAGAGLLAVGVVVPPERLHARARGVPEVRVEPAVEMRPSGLRPESDEAAPLAPPLAPPSEGGLEAVVRAVRRGYPDVARHPDEHRFQLLVTVLDPDAEAPWQRYARSYRADAEYFYPASAVKTFLAVAALRRLALLDREHAASLGLDTPLRLCVWAEPSCRLRHDPSNLAGGHITVGHELRKMMLVSSNIAFNRLFDFVGRDEANAWAERIGLRSVRLWHRVTGGAPGGGSSPRLEFHPPAQQVVEIPARRSEGPAPQQETPGLKVGRWHRAYFDHQPSYPVPRGDHGRLRHLPADFSQKNAIGLVDLHRLLLALARPELVPEVTLGLLPAHRAALLDAMSTDPLDSPNPPYEGSRFAEVRFKPILRGARRVLPRSWLRVVGKSGRAYGFEVDNVYLENRRTGQALAITAAVYVNPNGVVGDDGYAYPVSAGVLETVGRELVWKHLR